MKPDVKAKVKWNLIIYHRSMVLSQETNLIIWKFAVVESNITWS